MALIQCPECNQQISDSAKSCPNCGYSISERYKYVVQIQEYDTDTSALAGINSVFGINLSYNQCTHILNNLSYNFGDFSNLEYAQEYCNHLSSPKFNIKAISVLKQNINQQNYIDIAPLLIKNKYVTEKNNDDININFGTKLLCFIFPLIGLIIYALNKKTDTVRQCLHISIISIIIIIIGILFL